MLSGTDESTTPRLKKTKTQVYPHTSERIFTPFKEFEVFLA